MIPTIRRWPVPVECAALPPPARCRTSGPGGPAPTPRTHTRRTPALPHHRITPDPPRDPSGEKDSLIRGERAGASGRAAAGFASTSLNPRARLLEVRARGLSDVLVGRGVRRPDVETCTSHSRCAFCSRERRLELHFRVRSAPLGVRGGAHRGRRPTRGATLGDRGGAGCPNPLQSPRSRRGARRESLIFRASSRRRSRLGAPLQQIRT